MKKVFAILFPKKYKELQKLLFINKHLTNINKEIEDENNSIKKYISLCRSEALKNSGENTGLLIFIQKLEESFTWLNKYTKKWS